MPESMMPLEFTQNKHDMKWTKRTCKSFLLGDREILSMTMVQETEKWWRVWLVSKGLQLPVLMSHAEYEPWKWVKDAASEAEHMSLSEVVIDKWLVVDRLRCISSYGPSCCTPISGGENVSLADGSSTPISGTRTVRPTMNFSSVLHVPCESTLC